jgi:hypothetical protein
LVASVLLVVWLALVLAAATLVDSTPFGVTLIAVLSLVCLAGYQRWRDGPA